MKKNEIKSLLRELAVSFQLLCIRLCRNTRALWLRIMMAIRHKDADATIQAIAILATESLWVLCWLIVVLCFFAGFFKAQGFALSLAFVFVAAILRTICNDMNPNCKITE